MRTVIRALALFIGWLFLMLAFGGSAQLFGQNTGEMLPSLPPTFFNASGLVAAAGRLCTTATGTSTNLATYSDTALTTALPNPIVLDSLGRPTTNGTTLTSIFLGASSYRIALYANGTGNTCNGTAVGTQLWSRDGVYNLKTGSEKNMDNVVLTSTIGFLCGMAVLIVIKIGRIEQRLTALTARQLTDEVLCEVCGQPQGCQHWLKDVNG